MRLTQEHELRIAAFLNEIEVRLAGLSAATRAEALSALKRRVIKELERFRRIPTDRELNTVLQDCALALAKERKARNERVKASPGLRLSTEGRRWLGVCAGLADRFGAPVSTLRGVWVILGLVTGPVAVILYLLLFFPMYFMTPGSAYPRIEWLRLTKFAAGTFAAVYAFHGGVQLALAGFSWLAQRFLEQDLVSLGGWDWLEFHDTTLFGCALALLWPLGVLAGLPLANAWDRTSKKIVQAGLAAYALILAFGIACVLVGILLRFAENATGISLTI